MRASILCFFLTYTLSICGFCQNKLFDDNNRIESKIIVDQILIIGSKKTKSHIIEREFSFHKGDTLLSSDTSSLFTRTRNNIFNTELFTVVKSKVYETDSSHYIFLLELKERWYFWPIPIIELADRNFNEWVQERGANLSRINFGVDFRQENFRGRKEELHIKVQLGFTKKYEVFYTIPYIDKNRKTGIKIFTSYSSNKIIAFETANNKLQYHESKQIARKRFYGGISLLRRSKLYGRHEISLRYKHNYISDTIQQLNPSYYLENRTQQQYFEFRYRFKYDKRDISYYALKGHYTDIKINQLGLALFDDISQFESYISHSRHYKLSKKSFISSFIKGKFSTPLKQPYANNKAMGYYENFVRGYELYVVDGQKFVLSRNEYKLKLYDRATNIQGYIGENPFSTVPLQVYLKTYIDLGWTEDVSYSHLNPLLNDRLMYGIGTGIDFVTFYNAVFRLEYSLNHLNEHGVFFHIGSSF